MKLHIKIEQDESGYYVAEVPALPGCLSQGKTYEDKGVILKLDPEHILEYSHYSPLTGQPDVPESYHTVTIELFRMETGTSVTLSQDNNATEEDRQHSQQNWTMMLTSLKRVVETSA